MSVSIRFAGYAAVFDHPDRGGDVIRKGAFSGAKAGLPVFWCHDATRRIGTVETVAEDDRGLRVTGVILCMHEKHTLLASEVANDLESFLDGSRQQDVPWRDAVVLKPTIRRNIKLAEAPSFGKTILDYAPDSNGAEDYRALAKSVVTQHVEM